MPQTDDWGGTLVEESPKPTTDDWGGIPVSEKKESPAPTVDDWGGIAVEAPKKRTAQELADDPDFDPVAHLATNPDDVRDVEEAAWLQYQKPASVAGAINTAKKFGSGLFSGVVEGIPSLVRGAVKGIQNVGTIATKDAEDPALQQAQRENAAGISLGVTGTMKMADTAINTGKKLWSALPFTAVATREDVVNHLHNQAAFASQMEEQRKGILPSDDPNATAAEMFATGAHPPLQPMTEAEQAQMSQNIDDISQSYGDVTNIPVVGAVMAPGKIISKAAGGALKAAGATGEAAAKAVEFGGKVAKRTARYGTPLGAAAYAYNDPQGAAETAAAIGGIWLGTKVLKGASTLAKEAGSEVLGAAPIRGQSFYRKAAKEGVKGGTIGLTSSIPMMAGAETPEEAGAMVGPAGALGATTGLLHGAMRARGIESEANRGAMVKAGEASAYTPEETAVLSKLNKPARDIVHFWRGYFEGATTPDGKPMQVIPVDEQTFIATAGQASRGAYFDDGRLLVNVGATVDGKFRPKSAPQIAETFAHEGKHALDAMMGAAQPEIATALSEKLKGRFTDNGKPTPEFQGWIDGQLNLLAENLRKTGATDEQIQKSLATKDADYWLNEASADIGQSLITGSDLGEFLLPQGMVSRVWDGIKDWSAEKRIPIPSPADVQSGALSLPSAQAAAREVRRQLYAQGQESLARLDKRAEGPSADQRAAQLREIIAKPKPVGMSVDEAKAFFAEKQAANRELRELGETPTPVVPAGGKSSSPSSSKPVVSGAIAAPTTPGSFHISEGVTDAKRALKQMKPSGALDSDWMATKIEDARAAAEAEGVDLKAMTRRQVADELLNRAMRPGQPVNPNATPTPPAANEPLAPRTEPNPPIPLAPTAPAEGATATAVAVVPKRQSKIGIAPHPSGAPDLLDIIMQEGGLVGKGKASEAGKDQYSDQRLAMEKRGYTALMQGSETPDNMAMHLQEHGIGDGTVTTVWKLIGDAINGRESFRNAEKTGGESAQEKQGLADAQKHVSDLVSNAENAERALIASEGKKDTSKAAQDRIRKAKMQSVLGELDENSGLHLQTDQFGIETIRGDFDPTDPRHTALAELGGGITKPVAQRLVQFQQRKETPTYIRYRSARSAEEGAETGMKVRTDEYSKDPASERETGTIQHKVVIPLETEMSTTKGTLAAKFFVPDNVLHNIASVFEGLKTLGEKNPYGETAREQEPLVIQDANAAAQNHAHGWRGDGSGPIERFPDTAGIPEVDRNWTPLVIPKERFDILNMAMHSPEASRLADVTAKIQAKVAAKEPVPKSYRAQEHRAQEAYALAQHNERWTDDLTGETNQLRARMKAAGVSIGDRFKSPFETLAPQHILEISDKPIALQPGDIPSVRPTGLDIDPAEVVRSGRMNPTAVRASFMPEDPSYQGEHGAPDKESGAPLHEVTGNGIYPDDVYTHGARYYGTGNDRMDAQAFAIINKMKGRPNAKVTVYRTVPESLASNAEQLAKLERQMSDYMRRRRVPYGEDANGWYDRASERRDALAAAKDTPAPEVGINTGDWVTPVRAYAVDHGKSALNGKYKILSKVVAAKDIFTNGDSALEWGYDPQPSKAKFMPDSGKPEEGKTPGERLAREAEFDPKNPDIRFLPEEKTPKQRAQERKRDREYLAAAESGELATAQRLVDAAAKAAGYKTGVSFGKHKDGITTFRDGGYGMFFTDSKDAAESYNREDSSVIGVHLKMENPATFDLHGTEWFATDEHYPGYQTTDDLALFAKESGHDGAIFKNVIDDGNSATSKPGAPITVYSVFDPSQIKSADPVTKDDQGRVIPLSERFNPESNDIRFMPEDGPILDASDPEWIQRFETLYQKDYREGTLPEKEETELDTLHQRINREFGSLDAYQKQRDAEGKTDIHQGLRDAMRKPQFMPSDAPSSREDAARKPSAKEAARLRVYEREKVKNTVPMAAT